MISGYGKIDKLLLLAIVVLALVGLILLYSATYIKGFDRDGLSQVFIKQCVWIFLGMVLMLLISQGNYIRALDYSFLVYALIDNFFY